METEYKQLKKGWTPKTVLDVVLNACSRLLRCTHEHARPFWDQILNSVNEATERFSQPFRSPAMHVKTSNSVGFRRHSEPISCLVCVNCMLEQRECRGESDAVSESHTNKPPQAEHKDFLTDMTLIQSTNNCWLLGKVVQHWKTVTCWLFDLRP